ncbi:MAG: transcriptional repressor [Candidatus Micrarchaeota archaeon]|nr:transcriptional repressor [Candidatus Micrarchaeota archaeon]
MSNKSRKTKQKELLYKIISKQKRLFSAKNIYDLCKKNKIGFSTVYRFINSLVKKGVLHKFYCNEEALYSLSSKSHTHLICENCNSIFHLKEPEIKIDASHFKNDLNEFQICHIQIDMFGICKSCLNKQTLTISDKNEKSRV